MTKDTTTKASPPESSWQAKLKLAYETHNNKTYLSHRSHFGPLLVQKPFYPEDGVCHTYLIHPPGGVAGGDNISVSVDLAKNSHALITTPASGKFYCAKNHAAVFTQSIKIGENACMEWLPQDNIIYNGARLVVNTDIYLCANSCLFYWDMQMLGRVASGEAFERGQLTQSLNIYRDQRLLHIEKNYIHGNHDIYTAMIGYQSKPVSACFVITPVKASYLSDLKYVISEQSLFSFSLKNDVLICRFLGKDIRHARRLFLHIWTSLRPLLINKQACYPRIWAT